MAGCGGVGATGWDMLRGALLCGGESLDGLRGEEFHVLALCVPLCFVFRQAVGVEVLEVRSLLDCADAAHAAAVALGHV